VMYVIDLVALTASVSAILELGNSLPLPLSHFERKTAASVLPNTA